MSPRDQPEEGAGPISRATFDALYNDPALATLRSDLAAQGHSADTLYWILLAYDTFVSAHPVNPAGFSKDALRADLSALFVGEGISDRFQRDLLGRMANMLWVEIRAAPAWHLRDLSPDGLRDLYNEGLNEPIWRGDYASFFLIQNSDFQFQAEDFPSDNTLGVSPLSHFLLVPLARQITAGAASSKTAVEALVFWLENRLFHPYINSQLGEDWTADAYLAYPMVETDLYYPGYPGWHDFFDLFRERIADCHLAAALLQALASSINIPVLAGQVDYPPQPHGGHGVAYFRDLDRFVHGDWIAEMVGIPANQLLLDRATFIQTLAAGHAPGRLNEDYLDWEVRLQQMLPIHLALSRTATADTLYLSGSIEVCQSDQAAIVGAFGAEGHQFTCGPTVPGQETLIGCTSMTCQADGNATPIHPYAELVPEPASSLAEAVALLALAVLVRRRSRRSKG